jgi:diguanylate cyclase (GGDEF)-like protein
VSWLEVAVPTLAIAAAVYLWRRAAPRAGEIVERPADLQEGREPPASRLDEVTGLPDVGLLRTQDSAGPSPQPLTLITISIDGAGGAASLGDTGERALMELAHTVRSILRAGDTCVRGDGDQLMAVLPGLDARTSTQLVTRVRHAVNSLTLVTRSGGEVHLAVNVGRSSVPQDGESLDALLALARKTAEERRQQTPAGQRLSRAVPLIPN